MITPCSQLGEQIRSGRLDKELSTLYGKTNLSKQKQRYLNLLDLFAADKPIADTMFIISPGRTELGGNHTDHNNGCVLAAAVDLDFVATVAPIKRPEILLHSEDYPDPIQVNLTDLRPQKKEQGKPEALIRGVVSAFARRTPNTFSGGFHGQLHASCLPGTGLSSSAAFSNLIGAALNFLYNDGRLTAQTLAVMAREAENDFFGKPCGLMDQMASAVGETIFIDFKQPDEPVVEKIHHSLTSTGYQLAVINTGGNHVELTDEYAAIPREMKEAAGVLGRSSGRGISVDELLGSLGKIRVQAGDRAALRLLHFVEENDRVQAMAILIKHGKFGEYLQCVKESGASSCQLLQNCATTTSNREQGILLALTVSRRICPQAVCRVHGGGFAGTIQAYVPETDFDTYRTQMEEIFGGGSVMVLRIGRPGICGLTGSGLILPDEH